ncbi:phosphonate metabolism protein [Oceanicola sp. 22II-s10i]|uniref:DUF1045 domain-containing protein n=1 Tax=Oceanicola sp. 22II-s10i TaxID=1317116 RepID=UPI000B5261F1|nr:DUF1045 domain-containing protein [Oceanicola sp. 22II-s10i]OWU85011.1 phosphonate metabolism protein [Oceanicola sp. 22II-s10i]
MTDFSRYAVYYARPPGPLAEFAAAWLGWDPVAGAEVPHPDLPGLPRPVAEITATPRKYGFHGTIKPPFRLNASASPEALASDLDALCSGIAPVHCDGLELHRLGGFLALVPTGDTTALAHLAAEAVRALDHHRAPAPEAELNRRRARGLSPSQEVNLMTWGYPHVMEDFRFHLTLSGRLPAEEADAVAQVLTPILAPMTEGPFVVPDLCLFGEDAEGRFHLVSRHALTG